MLSGPGARRAAAAIPAPAAPRKKTLVPEFLSRLVKRPDARPSEPDWQPPETAEGRSSAGAGANALPMPGPPGTPAGEWTAAGPERRHGTISARRPSVQPIVPASSEAVAGDVPHDVQQSGDPADRPVTPESPAIPPPPAPAPALAPAPAAEMPRLRIPVLDTTDAEKVTISGSNDRISLTVRDAPLGMVLGLIARQHSLNIVTSEGVSGNITVTLSDVQLEDALNALLAVNGYTWVRQSNIILVSRLESERRISPGTQGRQSRVFELNYVSASDLDKVVKGLLSPAGQSFVTDSNPLDQRRTRERIVIEDLPEYLARIEEYILRVDQPPRQVLIEAHVFQVTLRDDTRNGIDFNQLVRLSGANLALRTQGFGNPTASPAFFLGVEGSDLNSLTDALQGTTDAKTLATPRVLVVNSQQARIQIGERLGYLLTTTTQTSTLQSVNFLEVGVVLDVTPVIADDNQVLMTVKPKVSSGRINPTTGLPEEATTEVESSILLPDGYGMVIGGLIREIDSDQQSKIPLVGDLWLVGRLFQRQQVVRERTEIIITLIPHILPLCPDEVCRERTDYIRATTPLFTGALDNRHRLGLEPRLPDAMLAPRRLDLLRIPDAIFGVFDEYPRPPEYYFPCPGEGPLWPAGTGEAAPLAFPIEPEAPPAAAPLSGPIVVPPPAAADALD
ncbi:MAG TPA: secretin and TonB N-terminal domain-containing protein [Planctomycetaceae bacterium]|nr:secretin and TonB N-terminal domain-containing protein [Planctomycetaceae bacterium]